MIEVIDTRYIAGETRKVFESQDVNGLLRIGFFKVRGPRFEGDPYILSKPAQVIVRYIWYDGEREDELKAEIKKAYNRYYYSTKQKQIKNFTRKAYQQFVEDLSSKQIIALPNKFNGPDIWFKVIK